jgi:hypothetical protein
MTQDESRHTTSRGEEFSRQASGASTGLVTEFVDFLRENKKWWMVPIIVTLVLLGALLIVTATPLGPFLYTLF